MINLEEKIQRANETYLNARNQLDKTRDRYQKGSGKVYADFLKRQRDLLDKIDQTKSEIAWLDDSFKTQFAKAGYERTKEVKNVLREKSEVTDMLAELETAYAACEREMFLAIVTANKEAKEFKSAYDNTYVAWARWQAYKALKESGESIARALALLSHAHASNTLEDHSFDVVGLRQKFVFDCLKELAHDHAYAKERPVLPELGGCDLGPFNSLPFLSPAEISSKSKALGVDQSPSSDHLTQNA